MGLARATLAPCAGGPTECIHKPPIRELRLRCQGQKWAAAEA